MKNNNKNYKYFQKRAKIIINQRFKIDGNYLKGNNY